MNDPHRPASPAPLPSRPWTVTGHCRPVRAVQPTRHYETMWRGPDGRPGEATRIAPASRPFESAFAALARGALIATPKGEVAIEDLVPGMIVTTRSGAMPVRWIGRMTLPPANLRQDGGPEIFRLTSESLGNRRPTTDLVLGAAARLLHRATRPQAGAGATEVLVPVGEFADGISVTPIAPMSAIVVHHLALDGHAVIEANGVPVETYHPGRNSPGGLSGDMLRLFLSLFPYLQDLRGFGPVTLPRLSFDNVSRLPASA